MENKCLKTTIKSCNIRFLETKRKEQNYLQTNKDAKKMELFTGKWRITRKTCSMCSIDLETLAEEG